MERFYGTKHLARKTTEQKEDILLFAARGGDLAHLVSSVCLVCVTASESPFPSHHTPTSSTERWIRIRRYSRLAHTRLLTLACNVDGVSAN